MRVYVLFHLKTESCINHSDRMIFCMKVNNTTWINHLASQAYLFSWTTYLVFLLVGQLLILSSYWFDNFYLVYLLVDRAQQTFTVCPFKRHEYFYDWSSSVQFIRLYWYTSTKDQSYCIVYLCTFLHRAHFPIKLHPNHETQ